MRTVTERAVARRLDRQLYRSEGNRLRKCREDSRAECDLGSYDVVDARYNYLVEANIDLGLPVDSRDYGVGSQILYDVGVRSMRLLTNNPTKRAGIEGYGLTILDSVPVITERNLHNDHYLKTKVAKLGHLLDEDDAE